jgi:hypothetical protein
MAAAYNLEASQRFRFLSKDWGTGQIGAQIALGGGFTAVASFSGQVGQNGVVTYGGQAGLNVAW